MTFDEKIDHVERLFSWRKKFTFLRPVHGFYATGVGAVFSLAGYDNAALLIMATSIVIGCVGILTLFIGHKKAMKGFKLLEACSDDFSQAEDGTELTRRMKRHATALNNFI